MIRSTLITIFCLASTLAFAGPLADKAAERARGSISKEEFTKAVGELRREILRSRGTAVERAAGPCLSDADCSGHGKCNVASGFCACDSGWSTPNANYNGNQAQCSYPTKFRLQGVLLQAIPITGIFGGGEWYLENYPWAAMQLVLALGGTAAIVVGGVTMGLSIDKSCTGILFGLATYGLGLGAWVTDFALYVAGAALIGTGQQKDANGQETQGY